MRTTVALEDNLLAEAKRLTQINDTTPLLREALKALIAREAARRLAALGGSDPDAKAAPRRRTCLLYTSPSPRDRTRSRMPSSA